MHVVSFNLSKLSAYNKKAVLFFSYFFFCICFAGCSNQISIVHDLPEREANEIIVFLKLEGVDAEKVRTVSSNTSGGGGAKAGNDWEIAVDSSQAPQAMSILSRNGLPRKKSESLLTLFSNDGLVPNEIGQRIRKQQGENSEIANTIRKFDGIIDVNVHISIPDTQGTIINTEKKKITASIYVKHNGVLDDPNSQLPSKIKRLVAGAVSDLELDNITVIADRAQLSTLPINLSYSNTSDYVVIWSMVIGKNSAFLFRTIFFSFCMGIFLLLAMLGWMIWKFQSLIKGLGGWNMLLNAKQLTLPEEVKTNLEEDLDTELEEEAEGEEENKKTN